MDKRQYLTNELRRVFAEHTEIASLSHEVAAKMADAAIAALEPVTVQEAQAPVVRYANDELEEVFAENVGFHLEQMNDGHWWIGLTRPDGTVDHINLTTKRNSKIAGRCELDQ